MPDKGLSFKNRFLVTFFHCVTLLLKGLAYVPAALAGYLHFLIRKMHFWKFKAGYVARTNDIFVVTYPKSGTTWVQMILYQLTTDGEMDFEHINDLMPHLENDLKFQFRHQSYPSPRIIKTHLGSRRTPKGRGKYIYVTRNGMDVAVSYYHHYCSFHGFKGSFDQFYERFMRDDVYFGSWFQHVSDWYANRFGLDVLYLKFEDLSRDLPGSIRQIASFCGIEIDEASFPRIIERSGFAFMKEHEDKFDLATVVNRRLSPPKNTFIRKGKVGQWASYFDDRKRMQFKQRFERSLSGLGLDDESSPS